MSATPAGGGDAAGGGVLVVGSVNVDLVITVASLPRAGETVGGGSFARHAGGKGANQAVAAARWGAAVRFAGVVGDDELGAFAVAELAGEAVAIAGVSQSTEAPTGVALIVVDAAGENQIAVASGANDRVDGKWVGAALAALAPLREHVCVLNLEIPDDGVLAAAYAARDAGMALVVNPAPARPLPDALLDLAPLLVPNADEARVLSGESEPLAAARALAARTGAPVVVTVGAAGALLVEDGRVHELPAPQVRAVDTTGAGDTLCGVLAAEIALGTPTVAALRRAVDAAARATLSRGARAGMPRRPEASASGMASA
jgi:ribokinase